MRKKHLKRHSEIDLSVNIFQYFFFVGLLTFFCCGWGFIWLVGWLVVVFMLFCLFVWVFVGWLWFFWGCFVLVLNLWFVLVLIFLLFLIVQVILAAPSFRYSLGRYSVHWELHPEKTTRKAQRLTRKAVNLLIILDIHKLFIIWFWRIVKKKMNTRETNEELFFLICGDPKNNHEY